MALNQATKYGLFFVGGIAVGALGMALVSRGKLNIKPLATDLLASGIDLRDKALAAVDGVITPPVTPSNQKIPFLS